MLTDFTFDFNSFQRYFPNFCKMLNKIYIICYKLTKLMKLSNVAKSSFDLQSTDLNIGFKYTCNESV